MNHHDRHEKLPRWDLSDYYKSLDDPRIKSDMQEMMVWSEKFRKRFMGKVGSLADLTLRDAIKETYQKDDEYRVKLDEYAEHSYSMDILGAEENKLRDEVERAITEYRANIEFFETEIGRLSLKHLAGLKKNPEIPRKYTHYIEYNIRGAKHRLDTNAEEAIRRRDQTLNRFYNDWEEADARLTFPLQKKKLTRSDIQDVAELSHEENDRRQALDIYRKGLEGEVNPGYPGHTKLPDYAGYLNGILDNAIIRKKERNYAQVYSEYYEEDNIYNDRIPMRMARALEKSDVLPRYYKLKAELMGKAQLDPWDVRAPLPNGYQHRISWEETVDVIKAACHRFHPEIGEMADKIFNGNVIHAAPKSGKFSGNGYTLEGTSKMLPHLAFNFHGSMHDAATVAHEMFHAIAMQMSKEKQGKYMSETPTVIAEVMAAVGEELFYDELTRRAKSTKEKKAVLFHKLENTMYALNRAYDFTFAVEACEKKEKEKRDLTADEFSEMYGKSLAKRFGGAVKDPEKLNFLWGTKGHLFSEPFYLSDYPIPNLIVNCMFTRHEKDRLFAGTSDMPQRFVDMIHKGGTEFTEDLLKGVGIHIEEPGLWTRGIHRVDKMMEKLHYMHKAELVQAGMDTATGSHAHAVAHSRSKGTQVTRH